MSNGHRWSKFWWQDWQNDPALRMCSLAAQGLWMRLLCVMHEAEPVGLLLVNGRQPSIRQVAALAAAPEKEVALLMQELEEAGVFSRADDGTIYSRRMVRDAEASEAGREHIAKRWNGARPTSPPNRGGNREATSRPNGEDHSPPTTPPITPDSEAQTEPVQKERKEVLKKPFFSGTAARAERSPDALEAVLSEAGVKPPEPKPVGAEVVQMEVRRTKKALEMRIPYGEVRSVEAQLDAIKAQPAAVGAEMTMGLKWQPAEAVRTPEEQAAALLAGITPEQLEKARRAFAVRAS